MTRSLGRWLTWRLKRGLGSGVVRLAMAATLVPAVTAAGADLPFAPALPAAVIDRVADALAAGEAAESDRSGAALFAAARRLDRLAAHPLAGQDDLAARWRRHGDMLGARDGTSPMRGRALGPAYRGGLLAAGARLDIDQIFLGGETAMVVVVPQKGLALQIRIADPDRAQICDQAVQSPKTACRWLPVFTTRFRISVTNPTTTPARYYLVSN